MKVHQKKLNNMKNALILHGISNNHTGNWFPWLAAELTKKGYKVWAADMPDADRPNVEKITPFILSKWKFDGDSIIVGHSSGATASFDILEHLPNTLTIKAAFFVAAFTDNLGMEEANGLFLHPYDWKLIKTKAKKFVLFESDDDPYVPFWHAEKLRDELAAELVFLKGQGHFNLEKGPQYKQFPKLLEKILE